MSRIGFLAGENNEEIVDEIIKISKLPYIEIEGIFSHFATSDEYDKSYTLLQYGRFRMFATDLKKKDLIFRLSIFATVPE